ncbi:MAG: hypothetical protein JKY00_10190 [Roseicyclus sp.]|nr:hypothetical protein [Roseicyclus sp.]
MSGLGGGAGPLVALTGARRGVIAQAMPQADSIGFSPPLCLNRDEADIIVSATVDAVTEVLG